MPRQTIIRTVLPPQPPDRCYDCPLIGCVPEGMKPKGSREGYVCLGTMDALTSKGIKVRKSKRDEKHPLKRWCDSRWEAWYYANPRHEFGIGVKAYQECRVPYQQKKQQETQLIIKFHS